MRLVVDSSTPRGFGQGGIGVVKGRIYRGHLLLSGDPGATVSVALIWGAGAGDRLVAGLPQPTPEWHSVPFEFTAGADSTDARLEITGRGTGRFRVGAVS